MLGFTNYIAILGFCQNYQEKKYDEELSAFVNEQFILVKEDGFYELTEKAYEHLKKPQKLVFDGWHYRGNEHVFLLDYH